MEQQAPDTSEKSLVRSPDKLDHTLARDLQKNIRGRISGIRHIILSSVVEGRYDDAVRDLRLYEDLNEMLMFRQQAERYFSHCEELIRAIDSKKKFAESKSITRTQKEDLYSMVRKHFAALSESLKRIEALENNLRVQDMRSTTWVVRTATVCLLMILGTLMVKDMPSGLVQALMHLVQLSTDKLILFIF